MYTSALSFLSRANNWLFSGDLSSLIKADGFIHLPKEQNEFKRHIQLQPVSETREEFVKGELYRVGEEVIVKETNQVGKVTVLVLISLICSFEALSVPCLISISYSK